VYSVRGEWCLGGGCVGLWPHTLTPLTTHTDRAQQHTAVSICSEVVGVVVTHSRAYTPSMQAPGVFQVADSRTLMLHASM